MELTLCKMFLILAISSLLVCGMAMRTWELPDDVMSHVTAELDLEWIGYKKVHNKTYDTDREEVVRRLYWEDTLRFIREHNLRYDRGEVTYTVGENKFSDLAEDEFEKYYLRGLIVPAKGEVDYPEPLTEPDPEAELEIDWRERGKVTPVKDQGQCGSCWAFSALGSLEAMKAIHQGQATDLSEQELVDCTTGYGNHACNGGWMATAYKYIKEINGIDSEHCYPYQAAQGNCRSHSDGSCVGAHISGYNNVGQSEDSLASDISKHGPVAVAVDVSERGFGSYSGGIYFTTECSHDNLNHAMVAVGYGSNSEGNYWIIKNSWGEGWGDKGYILMAKDRGNMCGIANAASYPTL